MLPGKDKELNKTSPISVLRTAQNPAARAAAAVATRSLSSGASLKEVLAKQVPIKQAEMKDLKAKHGHESLGEVTVDQCIGGSRDVKSMLYETSLLDANEVGPGGRQRRAGLSSHFCPSVICLNQCSALRGLKKLLQLARHTGD